LLIYILTLHMFYLCVSHGFIKLLLEILSLDFFH